MNRDIYIDDGILMPAFVCLSTSDMNWLVHGFYDAYK